jgi:hypothetical protein
LLINPSLSGAQDSISYKIKNPSISIIVNSQIIVNDPYPTPSFSAKITIIEGLTVGEDFLDLATLNNNINSYYDHFTGELTLSTQQDATVTPAEFQNALASVVFYDTNSVNPSVNNRVISFSIIDAVGVSSNFLTQIINVIAPPLRVNSYADQQFYITQPFQFQPIGFPIFVDPQLFNLTIFANGNNQALPSWATFNPQNFTFSGITPVTEETINFNVCANNTAGLSACASFDFSALPVYPAYVNPENSPLPDQAFLALTPFTFSIPEDAFIDPQGSKTNFRVQCNEESLPKWLVFDPDTRTFEGHPSLSATNYVSAASYFITVSAIDSYNLTSPSLGFNLSIDPGAGTKAATWIIGVLATTLLCFFGKKIKKSCDRAYSYLFHRPAVAPAAAAALDNNEWYQNAAEDGEEMQPINLN